MDIVSNLVQIGRWTLKGFHEQESNIALYLKLTRKNMKALSDRDLNKKFQPTFHAFCKSYEKLETEFEKGITDHRVWAGTITKLAQDLTRDSHLA